MKIMYLLFSFSVGGTEKLVKNICNEMSRRGHEIYIYIVNDRIDTSLIDELDSDITVYMQKRKENEGGRISTLFKIASFIKNNKIDIVHSNSFDAPELLLISNILNPRVKVVHTIHGMGQYKELNWLRKLYRNIFCDRLVGISDCVTEDMIKNGSKKKKTVTVYNGIDLPQKNITDGEKHVEYDTFTLGCLARISPYIKGQDVLVNALDILKKRGKELKCLIAGKPSEADFQEYQKLLDFVENKSLNRIQFLGNVEDVSSFFEQVHICVVPSRSEGFGLALVEAMALGVPCVASNIEGPKEIMEKFGIGTPFNVGNAESLADAIELVMDDYLSKRKIAYEKMDMIRTMFSIQQMCDELSKVYCE